MNDIDALILGISAGTRAVTRTKNREIEKLRERLGTVVMCIDRAKAAQQRGDEIEASEWINRAEQRARGETK